MSKCAPGCKCARHQPTRRHGQQKTCEECGHLFMAHRVDARFCTEQCRHVAYQRNNRERIRASDRLYAVANRERIRATQRRHDEKTGYARKRARYAEDSEVPERVQARRQRSREYYRANADRLREAAKQRSRASTRTPSYFTTRHGTDWDALFASLWKAQDGRCYLCGDPLQLNGNRDIHLDHDHSCCGPMRTCEKCRRGLACKRCNLVVGWAADDPDRLRRIAANLEVALAAVSERLSA